jgi:dTDP-4-dehydrorhamnose reductase
MNILVFGKDGQLGKAFKAVFDASKLDEQHRITYVGRAECELSNADAITNLLNQIKPDLIMNAAAYTAVDKAETEVDLAYAINAKAPEAMAIYERNKRFLDLTHLEERERNLMQRLIDTRGMEQLLV